MKLLVPDYFLNFKCIADKCTDSCCIGWEIDIDEHSRAKYAAMKHEIGKEIREKTTHGYFPLEKNGRCTFLDCKGLCRIISTVGDEYLCDICREHPRYYGIADGILEGGLGLACPEAARIILSLNQLPKLVQTEREVKYFDEDDYASFSDAIRTKLFSVIFKSDILELVGIYKAYASIADESAFEAVSTNRTPELSTEPTKKTADIDDVRDTISQTIELLEECDALTDDWRDTLKKARRIDVRTLKTDTIRSLLYYFTHRYVREGVEDMSIGGRILFALSSSLATAAIASAIGNDVSAALLYSKNIEYSTDNVDSIIDGLNQYL